MAEIQCQKEIDEYYLFTVLKGLTMESIET